MAVIAVSSRPKRSLPGPACAVRRLGSTFDDNPKDQRHDGRQEYSRLTGRGFNCCAHRGSGLRAGFRVFQGAVSLWRIAPWTAAIAGAGAGSETRSEPPDASGGDARADATWGDRDST